MIDISVKNIIKSFEQGNPVLNGIHFDIDSGERVGLLGKNGAGKTTLFRILSGELESDLGEVSIAKGKRVGMMSQIPQYPEDYTTEDVLKCAHIALDQMAKRMQDITMQLEKESTTELLKEYDRLTIAYESQGGYQTEMMRNKVANGLEIPQHMREQLFSQLSGGEKTRVNLARLILENTDILLLDEPTNHLDLKATEWLEEYLSRFHGTVIAISHDRYFLDRVVTRTIEIKNGVAAFYSGNYSFYVVERERRAALQQMQYEKEQTEAKRLQESAQRLKQWGIGNAKVMKKAFAMEKRIERMVKTERPQKDKKLKTSFSAREFQGDEVLVLESVSKGFHEKILFSGVNALITGGERIAIIGDNGVGKSTLIQMIMGKEKPDSGYIHCGASVKKAYLPQHIYFPNQDRSILDTLLYEDKCSPQTARNRLGAFMFSGEDVLKPISVLSGGELSRLYLCMLMKEEINFLILDEPTNHLDIASREWMEEALEKYDETLLFVSHDRYFVDRFATRIWEVKDGNILDFAGSFAQFQAWKARQAQMLFTNVTQKGNTSDTTRKDNRKKAKSPMKQIERMEREIQKCEAYIHELDVQAEQYATEYEKLLEIGEQKTAAEAQLLELYTQWEDLSS